MAQELHAGDHLGPYCLTQCLGAGGMGVVFQAIDESLNRTVAIKVLSSNVAKDHVFSARFLHEARAVAALNHPNIIQIYTVGQQNDLLFFAMEFVEGMSLDHLLRERGHLAEDEALELVMEAARGLQHALQHGMIHRDIKPANLIVTTEGDLKIADFGLSKNMSGDSIALTAAMATVGTPLYMSPEQARGLPLDHRTDLYALGITLYQLLAGRPPFLGNNPMDIMLQHISSPPPLIQQFCPSLSVAAVGILNKMIAKDAQQRHQSYEELIADLEAVLDYSVALPVVEEPSVMEYPEPQPRRSPFLMGAVILLSGILGGLLWNHWNQSEPMPAISLQQTSLPRPSIPALPTKVPTLPSGLATPSQVDPADVPVAKEEITRPKEKPLPQATSLSQPPAPLSSPDTVDHPARWANAINLLLLVENNPSVVSGQWRVSSPEHFLLSDNQPKSRLQFAYRPPAEYDYQVVFSRQSGEDDVILIVTRNHRQFCWKMGAGDLAGGHDQFWGFDLIQNRHVSQNPTGTRSGVENGRKYVCTLQVRNAGIKAYVDGKPIAEWKTNYSDFTIDDSFRLPDVDTLGVASWNSPTTFFGAQVIEVTGKGQLIHPSDSPPPKAQEKRPSEPAATASSSGTPPSPPPDSVPATVFPSPAALSPAARADSHEDHLLSESTRRVLPTEAEWTKLKALLSNLKNGDNSRVKELIALREKIYRRFSTGAEKWSAADFQARLEADSNIYALCKPTQYKGLIGVSLWNHLPDYLKQSKTPEQLAERLRALPALVTISGVEFVDRPEDPDGPYTFWFGGSEGKFQEFIGRKIREGIGKFVRRNQTRYQQPGAKLALFDFLKEQGVDLPTLEEMKQDLPGQ